jgi:hypothetical protein
MNPSTFISHVQTFSSVTLRERIRCRWENWIILAQDKEKWKGLLSTVMNIRAPYDDREFLSSWETGGL